MRVFYKIKSRLKTCLRNAKENMAYGKFGKSSKIIRPMRVLGKKHIYIGDNVHILNGARIEAVSSWHGNALSPELHIGDGTSMEQCCHIIADGRLRIGRNCCFSAFVYVADCSHQYVPGVSTLSTGLEVKSTFIGDNVFIGIGAKVLPGVKLGDGCVIGANAVVTHDIPPYSVAAGVPARVIKKYNFDTKKWEKTK